LEKLNGEDYFGDPCLGGRRTNVKMGSREAGCEDVDG
jgi:hypothetical protein